MKNGAIVRHAGLAMTGQPMEMPSGFTPLEARRDGNLRIAKGKSAGVRSGPRNRLGATAADIKGREMMKNQSNSEGQNNNVASHKPGGNMFQDTE